MVSKTQILQKMYEARMTIRCKNSSIENMHITLFVTNIVKY